MGEIEESVLVGHGRFWRRRAVAALALAFALLLGSVAGARADLVSGPYLDAVGDTGTDPAAVDILATTAIHVEHDDETSADDEVRLTALVRAPFNQQVFARSGEVVTWFLNADGHVGTGENLVAGDVGAERQIAVFKGPNGPAGELRRWTGLAYETLRPLDGDELTVGGPDAEGAQQISVEIAMADLALARGVVATFAVRSTFGAVADRAPATSGHQFAITPPPPPSNELSKPLVGTTAATGIRQDGITVSGLVNPGGLPTKFHFEYGLTTAYGQMSPPQDVVLDPTSPTYPVALVQRFLGMLEHGATYHYRLVATNAMGTGVSADNTFKLQDPRPPEIGDLLAADITQTSATLSAGIDPNGAESTYFFEYGPQDAPTPIQTPSGLTPKTAPAAGLIVTATLTDLRPGTTYRYTFVASSAFGGPIRTATLTFTTLPVLPPSVDTTPASEMAQTSATLNGVVDPNGLPSTYRFEYGLTSSYELGSTPPGQTGAGDAPVPITAGVSGLKPETIYHFRVVAESAAGRVVSDDRTLVTRSPPPPEATTLTGRRTGTRELTLRGAVTTNGVPVTAYFEWGQGQSLRRATPAKEVTRARALEAKVGGLEPGERYGYRLVVEGPAGRTEGARLFLRTRQLPELRAEAQVPLRCFVGGQDLCRVERFQLSVQAIDRDRDRAQTDRAATRGIELRLACIRGCSLTRSFTLRRGLRMASAGGRRVAVPVTASPGRIRANLTALFTDAAGQALALPLGAQIDVRLTKRGALGAGIRVRSAVRNKLSQCSVRGGRLAGCRPVG